jgi:hypothetical protein
MESDDKVFSNLPSDPTRPSAGAWAPAAWSRIAALQKTRPDIANTIAGLTPGEAEDYYFDVPNAPKHPDNILTDVLWHHEQDLQAAQNLQEARWKRDNWGWNDADAPVNRWQAQLDRLRGMAKAAPPQGRPLEEELNALSDAYGPNPPPTARDYQKISGVEPASVTLTRQPWQQPVTMPPFPANDPRGPGPPQGMTLNSMPMTGPQLVTRPGSGAFNLEQQILQQAREGYGQPQD